MEIQVESIQVTAAKKPYASPEIVEYGSITDLTRDKIGGTKLDASTTTTFNTTGKGAT
jgi:hypothetical protein